MHDRGFYYPLTQTPFSIADTSIALSAQICSFDEAEYQKKVQEFLLSKGCYEKGNACKKLLRIMDSVTKKQRPSG